MRVSNHEVWISLLILRDAACAVLQDEEKSQAASTARGRSLRVQAVGQSLVATGLDVLIDDFDDTMRAGIDKHRAAVDHGVAIIMCAVFRWHVVIGYAVAGQVDANPQLSIVGV